MLPLAMTQVEPTAGDPADTLPGITPSTAHMEYLYTVGEGSSTESYGYGIALAKVLPEPPQCTCSANEMP